MPYDKTFFCQCVSPRLDATRGGPVQLQSDRKQFVVVVTFCLMNDCSDVKGVSDCKDCSSKEFVM